MIGGVEAAVKIAVQKLSDLTGLKPAGVVAAAKEGDAWKIVVEMVEKKSTPESMDVLASYEVMLGPDGDLLSFTRGKLRKRGDTEWEA